MSLQLVVDNTKQTQPREKRTDEARNIAEFSIVRVGDFIGMLNKQSEDFPFIADNHGAQMEIFSSEELEIVLTPQELAEYWLSREKPSPNYPTALRAYDKDCRWVCGEKCVHSFSWICTDCSQIVTATGEEFGRYFSRNGNCLDCRRADAEANPIQQEDGSAPSNVFDFYRDTTGN
jgi:hypothetical protein